MTTPRANEPAFPVFVDQSPNTGLTKREYFAGLILQGIMASGPTEYAMKILFQRVPPIKVAILYADALLAELANGDA